MGEIIKKYSWDEFGEAMEESAKSLAELFDFKTGTLIWREDEEISQITTA